MSLNSLLHNNQKIWNGDIAYLQKVETNIMAAIKSGLTANPVTIPQSFVDKNLSIHIHDSKGQKAEVFTTDEIFKGKNIPLPEGAIALVAFDGVLYGNVEQWMEYYFGLISGARIARLINSIHTNKDIKAAGIIFNSPGGDGWATNEIVNAVTTAQVNMPFVGLVTEMSASASQIIQATLGYSIAANETTMLGSLGTYSIHYNNKGWYDRIGLEITYVTADENKHKTDWDDSKPLSKHALAAYKRRSNQHFEWIKEKVSANGKVSTDTYESDIYFAGQGIELGLVDEIVKDGDGYNKLIEKLVELTEDDSYNAPPISKINNKNLKMKLKNITDAEGNPLEVKVLSELTIAGINELSEGSKDVDYVLIPKAQAEKIDTDFGETDKGVQAKVTQIEQDMGKMLETQKTTLAENQQLKSEIQQAKKDLENTKKETQTAKDNAERFESILKEKAPHLLAPQGAGGNNDSLKKDGKQGNTINNIEDMQKQWADLHKD